MSHFRSLLFFSPAIVGGYISLGLAVSTVPTYLNGRSYAEQVYLLQNLTQREPSQHQLAAKRYLDQLFTMREMRDSEPDPSCLADDVVYEEASVRAVGRRQVSRLVEWASRHHPMGHTAQSVAYPSADELVAVYDLTWRGSISGSSIVRCPTTVRARLQPDGRIQSILLDLYGAETVTKDRNPFIYQLLGLGPIRSSMRFITYVMP